jgi:hypothetical protein
MSGEVQNGGHAVYRIGRVETAIGAARFVCALTGAVARGTAGRTLEGVLAGTEVIVPRVGHVVEDVALELRRAGKNGQIVFKAIAAGVQRGLRGAAH